MAGKAKSKAVRVARSAISGRFVKMKTAARHPRVTVVETRRTGKKK